MAPAFHWAYAVAWCLSSVLLAAAKSPSPKIPLTQTVLLYNVPEGAKGVVSSYGDPHDSCAFSYVISYNINGISASVDLAQGTRLYQATTWADLTPSQSLEGSSTSVTTDIYVTQSCQLYSTTWAECHVSSSLWLVSGSPITTSVFKTTQADAYYNYGAIPVSQDLFPDVMTSLYDCFSSTTKTSASNTTNAVSSPTTSSQAGSTTKDNSKSGLSTGAVAGIAVGAAVGGIALFAAVIFVGCICLRRRRRNKSSPPELSTGLAPGAAKTHDVRSVQGPNLEKAQQDQMRPAHELQHSPRFREVGMGYEAQEPPRRETHSPPPVYSPERHSLVRPEELGAGRGIYEAPWQQQTPPQQVSSSSYGLQQSTRTGELETGREVWEAP